MHVAAEVGPVAGGELADGRGGGALVFAVLGPVLRPAVVFGFVAEGRFEGPGGVVEGVVRQQPGLDEGVVARFGVHRRDPLADVLRLGGQLGKLRLLVGQGVRVPDQVGAGLGHAGAPLFETLLVLCARGVGVADGARDSGARPFAELGPCLVVEFRTEQFEERLRVLFGPGDRHFGERGEPAVLAEEVSGGHRQGLHAFEFSPGRLVGQVGQVLALEQREGAEPRAGGCDVPVDDRVGIVEQHEVAGAPPGQGHHQGVAGGAARAAGALHVARRIGGDPGHTNHREVADVDAQFQGAGGGEHVRCSPGATAFELALQILPLLPVEHAGVLGGGEVEDGVVPVAVVVVLVVPVAPLVSSGAAPAQARSVEPSVPVSGRDGALIRANRAHDLGVLCVLLALQPQVEVRGAEGVDRSGVGADLPHHPVPRQVLEQLAQIPDAVGAFEPQGAAGPVRQPGLLAAPELVELAAREAVRRVEYERGRAHPLRERGHARIAAAPDRPPVPAGALQPPVQPLVPDAAAHQQPVQHASGMYQQPLLAAGVSDEFADRGSRRGEGVRQPFAGSVAEVDLGRDQARAGEGPREVGAQPELLHGVEHQAARDHVPVALRALVVALHEPLDARVLLELGRDHSAEGLGLCGEFFHGPGRELGERGRAGPGEDVRNVGTQAEAVGPERQEPRVVGGVLDRVGEDQRLALVAAQVGVVREVDGALQDLREHDRGQGGDTGADEPDRVVVTARRAPGLVADTGRGVVEHHR